MTVASYMDQEALETKNMPNEHAWTMFILHALVGHRGMAFGGPIASLGLCKFSRIEGGSHLLLYIPCFEGCSSDVKRFLATNFITHGSLCVSVPP